MRAVRFEAKQVVVDEKPEPTGPGVEVRVRACGICGSDLTILDSGFPIFGTPGHEIAGELEDGTPVAIEPVAPCAECEFCRDGRYQVCTSGIEIIYGIGRDGGMAEEIRVPARSLVSLPRGMDASKVQIVSGGPEWYHPGRSGKIQLGPKLILGYFGELHPLTLETLDVDGPICGFEIYLDACYGMVLCHIIMCEAEKRTCLMYAYLSGLNSYNNIP